jgi:predicted transposase/invertase (TIGR01784 family)
VNRKLIAAHDKTFKELFGQKEIAKDVLQTNLPKEILKNLNLELMEKLDSTFISRNLRESFSDVVYGIRGNNKIYIAFLFEHKSYRDKFTLFQVARYIIELWTKVIKANKKELPIVIPIVIYHGQEKWNLETDIRKLIPDFETLPQYIKELLPVMKYVLINISDHTAEKIWEYQPITRLVIRIFKYAFEEKDKIIEEILLSIEEIGPKVPNEVLLPLIQVIFLYLSLLNKEIKEEDIIRKVKQSEGKGERILTILELREQKGIEKGLQQGLQKGLQQGLQQGIEQGLQKGFFNAKRKIAINLLKMGLSVEKVAQGAELTIKEVEELKKEVN